MTNAATQPRNNHRASGNLLATASARPPITSQGKVLAPDPMPVGETRDLAIPGPGGPIPARLYRASATGVLPVLEAL
jgi:hypothetical protein